jgi:high-affinity K+ transport system ATPase subunit B
LYCFKHCFFKIEIAFCGIKYKKNGAENMAKDVVQNMMPFGGNGILSPQIIFAE